MSRAYTYIVRCADGSLYTGWTTDLAARLTAHNKGRGARYTRSRLPVELVWSEEQSDQIAARRREAQIKQWTRQAKLTLIEQTETRRSLS